MSIFTRSGDWRDLFRQSPVTSIIFILNTLMLVAVLLTGGFEDGVVSNWAYINHDLIINQQQYYRLITGAFQHWTLLHYAMNMVIGVIFLSSALERLIGSWKFAIIYFVSLLISSLSVAILETNVLVRTAGASGAIFGVMGALLWLSFYRKDIIGTNDVKSIWVFVAFQVVATFVGPISSGVAPDMNVSVLGHMSGVITGFLIMYLVVRMKHQEPDNEEYYFH